MKIAFIIPEFPSLSQTFVLNEITGLLDRGHDVEIFAAKPSNDPKHHNDITKYNLLERTTYFPIVPPGRLKRISKGLRYAFSNFPKYPRPVIQSLNAIKFGKLAASFTLICRVTPFLGRGPYDIIHCHFGPFGNIAAQCRCTGALNGRLITSFHGYDLTSFPKKNGKHVYDMLFEHCDLCLPISNHWKNRLIEMGCSSHKIAVHRMGVDLKHFDSLRKSKKTKPQKNRILSVARLTEKKGIQYGIEAVSRILKRFTDIEYLIAGDGPLRYELEQLIRSLELQNNVHLLGWMNQEEVTELMCQADVLLAPSVTAVDGDQEGIPVVLMEALAMGLPVISTYHSGIPELIIDGETGFLVNERDTDGLADKLSILFSNDPTVARIKKNGVNFIRENYNIDKLNTALENMYIQLANIPHPTNLDNSVIC